MSDFLKLERFAWFDRQVKDGRYPNATRLSERFEVSVKTAQRAIDFMRDRLGAPLAYDPCNRGYIYTEATYSLPYLQVTQEEMLALLLAGNLLSHSAGGFISRELGKFGRRLFRDTGVLGLTEPRMQEAFSASWHEYAPAQDHVFRSVAQALLESRPLRFVYHSPAADEQTERVVEPHHLQHYMASWVLIGWCRLRSDWRKFYLSRMVRLHTLDKPFRPRPSLQWRTCLEGAWGIFQGPRAVEVVLRFNPFRARWIREQRWFCHQRLKELPGGGVELTVPVTDFREIRMKVLQFGADCEVLAPAELREQVRAELARAVRLYDP